MNWTELKKRIYFEDGSWRDIYVLDTTRKDWENWVDLINRKYSVEFYDAKTDLLADKIDFAAVREYWDSAGDREVISASIKLDSINVMCYFFDDSQIENDIDPSEIKSQEDHDKLIDYLTDISVSLDKEVLLTEENTKNSILIRGKGGEFILNSA
jgi:hypothetical protein